MASGSFETHVAEIVAARAVSLRHADFIFARNAQAGHWTANYAQAVWDASRPPKVPTPPGHARPVDDDEDDIPF